MRTVFTCGCFDLLHAGHVELLRQAKALGDQLVVGINSDESVAAIKGPGRPVNALQNRVAVLEAIRYVDKVVPFYEVTASTLVRELRPHVMVKGVGATLESTPEAGIVVAQGGEFVLLDGPALSTTQLIEKILGCGNA